MKKVLAFIVLILLVGCCLTEKTHTCKDCHEEYNGSRSVHEEECEKAEIKVKAIIHLDERHKEY